MVSQVKGKWSRERFISSQKEKADPHVSLIATAYVPSHYMSK